MGLSLETIDITLSSLNVLLPQCQIALYHFLPSYPSHSMCSYQDVPMANNTAKQCGSGLITENTHSAVCVFLYSNDLIRHLVPLCVTV